MTEHTIHDAQGAMQMIHLRPGLKLRIAGFKPGKTVKIRFKSEASCLRFTFLRDGKGYMTRHAGCGPAVKNKVYPVSFEPELEGSVCFPVGHRQSHFSIQISQSLMNTLLGERFQRVPYDLQAILAGCNNIDFYHYGPLTPCDGFSHPAIIELPLFRTAGTDISGEQGHRTYRPQIGAN